jgi:hypothetical protein
MFLFWCDSALFSSVSLPSLSQIYHGWFFRRRDAVIYWQELHTCYQVGFVWDTVCIQMQVTVYWLLPSQQQSSRTIDLTSFIINVFWNKFIVTWTSHFECKSCGVIFTLTEWRLVIPLEEKVQMLKLCDLYHLSRNTQFVMHSHRFECMYYQLWVKSCTSLLWLRIQTSIYYA